MYDKASSGLLAQLFESSAVLELRIALFNLGPPPIESAPPIGVKMELLGAANKSKIRA